MAGPRPFRSTARSDRFSLGGPLAASTQWGIIHDQSRQRDPAYAELGRQAAQADVVHNDDTVVKIQEFMGNPRTLRPEQLVQEFRKSPEMCFRDPVMRFEKEVTMIPPS